MRFPLAILLALAFILPSSAHAEDLNHAPTSPTRSQAFVARLTAVAGDANMRTPTRVQASTAPAYSIVWDSGYVHGGVLDLGNGVKVAVYPQPQTWQPCPPPLDAFACPTLSFGHIIWQEPLAAYESAGVNCGFYPDSAWCFVAYARYQTLRPIAIEYPDLLILKPPPPLPNCIPAVCG